MIARFLNEAVIQTLDYSKMNSYNDFMERFPDCGTANTSAAWSTIHNFSPSYDYNLRPIKYIAGKDWFVVAAVRKLSERILDLCFEICYCFERGNTKTWTSRTFESANLRNTDGNLTELRKRREEGLRMLSSVRDYKRAIDLLEKMFYNETRWKINISY